MTTQKREEIRQALKGAGLGKISDDMLSKCVGLASTLNISSKQMAECWEAYSLNKNLKDLNDRSYTAYRNELVKLSDVEMTDAEGAVTMSSQSTVMITPAQNNKRSSGMSTPPQTASASVGSTAKKQNRNNSEEKNRRVSLSPEPPLLQQHSNSSSLPSYSERQGAGKVVATFNPNKLSPIQPTTNRKNPVKVSYEHFTSNVQKPYRHMFTVLEERARQLDRLIEEKQDQFSSHFDFGSEQVAPLEAVGIPRQDTVCCIGRICNSAHEGRINATTVLLEGSKNTSGGSRVEVDLSYLKGQSKQSYSLFPGQIVSVEGLNCSGRKLVAQRICEGVAHLPNKSAVRELLQYADQSVKIVTASGPFTCSNNFDYEPFLDLISTLAQSKPDVVILTGPFVDMRHKGVAAGQTTLEFETDDGKKEEVLVSYEVFFANKIAGLIDEFFAADDEIHTQFVLVPSLDDATAEWVYPQAPFQDRPAETLNIPGAEGILINSLGLDDINKGHTRRRVHCVSNPCTLQINEMIVGVTSTDALFHMNGEETSANLPPGSRLGRIAQHMLQQQSYYPLFPGKINLNLKHIDQWKIPCAPDLLILPSKLAPFARALLNDTVVVNPGHLTRDTMGGTFAVVDIHPIARETLENAGGDDVELKHGVQDRTNIEIKRI